MFFFLVTVARGARRRHGACSNLVVVGNVVPALYPGMIRFHRREQKGAGRFCRQRICLSSIKFALRRVHRHCPRAKRAAHELLQHDLFAFSAFARHARPLARRFRLAKPQIGCTTPPCNERASRPASARCGNPLLSCWSMRSAVAPVGSRSGWTCWRASISG